MSEQSRPGRRRVFVTAGLTASAAVLAMAVQAGLDEEPAGPSYGVSAAAEPDAPTDADET
ncbi:hypothetical protein [Nocardioides sp.]|uniref:hypothetical protein n=1 Tax=Nocardioides sp. TaxID=35761 RepID=UPI00271C4744|nr:hypothetical protein [Nocardioides sp.]MDO9457229.1 hypothetical protein [Nocardioides sp.]